MNNEDIPYRSPILTAPVSTVSSRDEHEYSTLVAVEKQLAQAIEGLYTDFNAFKADDTLQAQVAGRQVAYDILVPLHEQVNSTIESIKRKNRGQ